MQAFWCLRDGNTIILTTKSVFKFKEYSTGTFIYIKTWPGIRSQEVKEELRSTLLAAFKYTIQFC